jgi:neopullulanase
MNRLTLVLFLLSHISVQAGSFFRSSARLPQQAEVIYLLMPDRFARGNADSTLADVQEGLDPKSATFFHGGTFRGLQEHLDYLQHLGVTSLWMTPIMKNCAVQDYGAGNPSKAG